ncbi:hypothetical protein HELRODRAFT_70359, partial [Helobdella robusta]|uniref:Agrin n=1 Tax=Helobdella robusta TaxID=6412 RepID=T1G054_HELRO
VCGSDGRSYKNECYLKKQACEMQQNIHIKFQGPCGKQLIIFFETLLQYIVALHYFIILNIFSSAVTFNIHADPCENVKCHYGSSCVAGSCRCQFACSDDEDDGKKVCGSDGRSYKNECYLKKQACEMQQNIHIKFQGPCDPCENVKCHYGSSCVAGLCQCQLVCSDDDSKKVCGSDGRSYKNECYLKKQACEMQQNIHIKFQGPCEVTCSFGSTCIVEIARLTSCQCFFNCFDASNSSKQVCGSDGKSYNNECELRKHVCEEQVDIFVKSFGPCGLCNACEKKICYHGSVCVTGLNGSAECQCSFNCLHDRDDMKICGSDGRSYKNECELKKHACEMKKDLYVYASGPCDPCENVVCHHGAVCKNASCHCTFDCPDDNNESKIVCGSDGRTYKNECQLKRLACENKRNISLRYNDHCDKCLGVVCYYGAVCKDGKCQCVDQCDHSNDLLSTILFCDRSSGITYTRCTLKHAECLKGSHIDVDDGPCQTYSPITTSAVVSTSRPDTTSTTAALITTTTRSEGSGSGKGDCSKETCKFGGKCGVNKEGKYSCICQFNCGALRSPVCGSDRQTYANECEMREYSCIKQVFLYVERDGNCAGQAADYNCMTSTYGCCSDGSTLAAGPDQLGCPGKCNCNKLGSYNASCQPVTLQCFCRPHVVGVQCDRCNANYWGMHNIQHSNEGCLPCHCNQYGSKRLDCDQNSGQCLCLNGVMGHKCDICSNGKKLSQYGCVGKQVSSRFFDVHCKFGARCHVGVHGPECVCDDNCAPDDKYGYGGVCGSDNHWYASKCRLEMAACRKQIDIRVLYNGPCDG